MVDVSTSIMIHRPIQEVAAFASDPDNVRKWYVNIHSVEWKTEKPVTLGSEIAFKARFLGREMSYVYKVVEYIPNEKMVMATSDGPFPMRTTYQWSTSEDGSTLMTLNNSGSPSGFSRFFTPFMSLMMKRANRKDLALLKNILEEKMN